MFPPVAQFAESSPLIGLIVPPADGNVPPEGAILYPHIRFIAEGLGLREMSPSGFDAIVADIVAKATKLAGAGAQAISVMGTSLTFYRGPAANETLKTAIEEATGLPTTTMSFAIARALKAMRVERVALATAYIDDLNTRLTTFLRHEGIRVAGIKGLAITDVPSVKHVPPATLIELAEAAFALDKTAQGVLISCGGLLTLDVIEQLEDRLGVPVVASSPAGFWDVVQVAGLDPTAAGFGRLFAAPAAGSQRGVEREPVSVKQS